MSNKLDLDVSNLSVGMVFKSYKDLCCALSEKIKDGNSKKSQLNEWSRYFAYKKQNYKFIITEIYDNPKPKKVDSLYVKYIELLLMYELLNKNGYTCSYTQTNLYHLLGMVNDFYLKENRQLRKENVNDIPNWQIDHFYTRCNKKLGEILISALKSMKRRCLIEYSIHWIIIDENGNRVAALPEVELILAAGQKVLAEMGCNKIPFMRINEFYENVNAKLNELYAWKCVYREINLVYSNKYMQHNINNVKSEIEQLIKQNKLELNSTVLQAIEKQAKYYLDKNDEEYKNAYYKLIESGWATADSYSSRFKQDIGVFIFPEDYMDNQKQLAKIFIDIMC